MTRPTRIAIAGASALFVAASGQGAGAQGVAPKTASPELDACQSSGLLALKEKSPSLKSLVLDPDGATIAKADTKVEDTAIRTVVMGDAYLEKKGSDKPYRFVCLIGDKGKVVLTFFTQQ